MILFGTVFFSGWFQRILKMCDAMAVSRREVFGSSCKEAVMVGILVMNDECLCLSW